MQTIYYTTSNFINHTDNVVDLGEYRRKLALAQEGSLAPQPEYFDSFQSDWEEEEAVEQPVLREVRSRRSHSREVRAWVLDACASLSIMVMALSFSLFVML